MNEGIKPPAQKKENVRAFQLEHIPHDKPIVDVVSNLDYPVAEDREAILDVLRDESIDKASLGVVHKFSIRLQRLINLRDVQNNIRFHVKRKIGANQKSVDYILGRTKKDPLTETAAVGADEKTRYAFNSVLNEIILSKKIKELIALPSFQDLAKRHGYTDLIFAEPIVAIVDKKISFKYLVYKRINGVDVGFPKSFNLGMRKLAYELQELFFDNGINAHDLRWDQFMMTEEGGQRHLVLIDVEAYTEK